MQSTRQLLTFVGTVVLASQFAGGTPGKAMCAMTCHSSEKGPSHPSMALQDDTPLIRALTQFKQGSEKVGESPNLLI